MNLHPGELRNYPNLVCTGESLLSFFPGCCSRTCGRSPSGRVCWEWPCGFLFQHISLFKLVLLKVVDSASEIMRTFTFSHRSSSFSFPLDEASALFVAASLIPLGSAIRYEICPVFSPNLKFK